MSIEADALRIAELERKVSDLYRAIGREEPTGFTEVSPEVRQLIADGKTIQAIKVHHEQTGLALADAKEAVDAYLNPG